MAENQHNFPWKYKFFRVLLLGFATKLAIPEKLTEYFIKENFTVVTLLSRLGESWSVRIDGNSAGLHFADGWERFKEAHRLSFGDFLVFEYVGGTVFNVTIFDKSTCEKDYKITNGVAGDDVPGQGENCDQGSEKIKEKTTAPPSSGQRSTPPVMEKETNMDQEQVSVGKEVQQPVHKDKKATKHMRKRGSRFEITISDTLKYTVRIPVKFARSNDLSGVDQMLLRNPEGHKWPVKLLHCNQSGFVQHLLSAGWRDFRIDNELKDGDVCVFKLKKNNKMLVQIRRSCGDGSCTSKSPLHQVGLSKRATGLQLKGSPSMVTRSSKPANPAQFRSIIVPTNVCKDGYMSIPKVFRSSVDLSAEKEVVLVDPNSRRWPVMIHQGQKDGRSRMRGGGWRRFCDETGVRVGDECVFTFEYARMKATFQVEVIKPKLPIPHDHG